jgi:hypothetical protein
MVRFRPAIAIAAIAWVAACQPPVESAPQSKAPAIEALGPAVNCIQTSRIRDTEVHDDQTIDFHMLGGDTYRNTLPNRCPSLGFEERFSYRSTTGQLCSVDVITVLYSDGTRGAGCGLGQFLPVRINKAD